MGFNTSYVYITMPGFPKCCEPSTSSTTIDCGRCLSTDLPPVVTLGISGLSDVVGGCSNCSEGAYDGLYALPFATTLISSTGTTISYGLCGWIKWWEVASSDKNDCPLVIFSSNYNFIRGLVLLDANTSKITAELAISPSSSYEPSQAIAKWERPFTWGGATDNCGRLLWGDQSTYFTAISQNCDLSSATFSFIGST